MNRFLFLLLLLVSTTLPWSTVGVAQSADGLPARPSPFRFVTDEAHLLSEANAKTLENGLRSYADNTGTQIVVVTVPTLGGRTVADYGRALGEAWGVGQRDKNNGIVLLLSGQERQVTIQAGSGLQSVITPAVTARVINQQMTPKFKQGNYFAGIRAGLNTLMLAANPDSNPNKDQPATATAPASASASPDLAGTPAPQVADPATEPFKPQSSVSAPEPAGLGIGTLAIGALLLGGVVWLLFRLFRRRNTAPAAGSPAANAPDFYGNQPNNPTGGGYNRGGGPQQQPGPDFYGNRAGNGMGGSGIGGGGMGGILATGAAAAAGAYLGNRMANGGHDESNMGHGLGGYDTPAAPLGAGAGAAGGVAGGSTEFPALGGTGANEEAAPDYFSGDNAGPDYFSSDDNSSYDDTSSDDTGGGGFDSDDDNSGSW